MTLLDIAFLIGPMTGPLLVTGVLVAVLITRPTEWAARVAIPISAIAATAWVTYWSLWGAAFDRVDAGHDPVTTLEVAMNAAMLVCATGCTALIVTALSAYWAGRSQPA